jgi:hypothetical protein
MSDRRPYTTCGRCGREYAIPAGREAARHTCADGVTLSIHRADPDYWLHPDTMSLGRAAVLLEEAVSKTKVAHIVAAVIYEGTLGFQVMSSDTYATLREKGLHHRLAPICSRLPNGAIELYPSLDGFIQKS